MSRLRIYSGGTGNLQYDSATTSNEERNEQARQEFNAGLLFLYRPRQGQLHSYVKIHRGAEEQFLAVYDGEGAEDVITGFKDALHRAVDDRGWKIVSANQVNQTVYEALGRTKATSPNVGMNQIEDELERRGIVDFVSGDGRTAVELFEYLREHLPTASIAITTSGRTSPVEDTDIVIEIDKNYDHKQPSVGAETAQRLHDAQVRADKESIRREMEHLAAESSASSRAGVGRHLAMALTAAGIQDRFGLEVRGEEAPRRSVELAIQGTKATFGLVGITALIYLTLAAFQRPPAGIRQSMPFSLVPTTEPVFSFQVWQFLMIESGLLVVTLLLFRSSRRLVGSLFKPLGTALRFVTTTGKRRQQRQQHPKIQAVLDGMGQLRSRTTSEERFISEIRDVFSNYRINVIRSETAAKNRLRKRVVGIGSGIVVGGVLTASLFGGTILLFRYVDSSWMLVLNVILVITMLLIAVLIGKALRSFLGPSRTSYQGRQSLSQTYSTSQSHSQDQRRNSRTHPSRSRQGQPKANSRSGRRNPPARSNEQSRKKRQSNKTTQQSNQASTERNSRHMTSSSDANGDDKTALDSKQAERLQNALESEQEENEPISDILEDYSGGSTVDRNPDESSDESDGSQDSKSLE